jgi:hypothetical protein
MSHLPTPRETRWLHSVLATLKQSPVPDSLESLESLRDLVVPLAWADGVPRARDFQVDDEPERFRRHPLASVEALGCAALLMYWPPGHATVPHDHGGLWGIEIVIDGVLSVNEFMRIGEVTRPTLVPTRSLHLGIGDAALFHSGNYVHRCRNLSNATPTLTLHVYGGALTEYNAYTPDAPGRYTWSRQVVRDDVHLS